MEGFTETTDITTPVEMAQESAPSKGVDIDTSYQISDLPEWSKHDLRMSTPETHHKLKSETLFDITDLDDLSDVEEDMIQKDNVFMSYSDRTLVPDRTMTQEEDSSPHVIETKIRIREDKIHEKFEKMSMSMSDPENTAEGEEFCQLSTSVLSKEDEEQAASNFDKILVDNFVEDKSEDWLTHESDPSPEKETGSGEIFGPPEKEKGTSDERASSSYSSDESGPESAPHSPSPKVSPGSKSPSPRVSPLKETEQELLDEMIIKDVPESESSTDPVKKFEALHPPTSIQSIAEDQEEASDSEYLGTETAETPL